jgi:hypothetical protein
VRLAQHGAAVDGRVAQQRGAVMGVRTILEGSLLRLDGCDAGKVSVARRHRALDARRIA